MEITRKILQRFVEHRCSPEEFEAVAGWIGSHPDDAARLLGWEEIDAEKMVEDHDPEEVLFELRRRLFDERRVRVRRMAWAAAAACLALVLGAGVWIRGREAGTRAVAVAGPASKAHWIEKRNSGDRALIIALPDSSTVKLYGHSSIRYSDSFGVERRDSWTEGMVDFVVRKDAAKPFVVYSGVLATEVLGTSFGVNSGIEVRLYTGKVVVHNPGGKDVYLTPGQKLSYDPGKKLAVSGRFVPSPVAVPVDIKGLAFNNTPLKEVFRRLGEHYHVKIAYRAADLAGLNFTGTMSSTDSLSGFLQLLGTMNGLEVREGPAGFEVAKPGP